ncbi:MAG: aminotransferase class I/II-fold pyridoxal phosphate-dependent enzyme [Chitinophagaceae bacterium]
MHHLLHEQPGRTVRIDGKEYLFFSGYAYLGMNKNDAFIELVKDGLDKYGLLFPSSRISNTRLNLYEEFENVLSNMIGSEETVCFSSGFLAGKAASSIFKNISVAPGAHPSINNKDLNDYKDFYDWSTSFIHSVNASESQSASVFAADSVNVLTSEINDFSFLSSTQKNIIAIIDDSHGIGLTGKNGKGISSLISQQKNVEFIFTYSLSKAFGLIGGAVSCSKKNASLLRATHEYTASTNISPAFMYAFIYAQKLYEQQREKLKQNIFYFQNLIKEISQIKFHADLPIFILPQTINEEMVFKNKIIISSFAYPNPSGKKIHRIIVNALHTKTDLEYLSECVKNVI